MKKGGPSCTVHRNANQCSHQGNSGGPSNVEAGACAPATPLPGECSKDTEPASRGDPRSPMLAGARFTAAAVWRQPPRPSVGAWMRTTQDTFTAGLLLRHNKGGNPAACKHLDGTAERYATGNKPDTDSRTVRTRGQGRGGGTVHQRAHTSCSEVQVFGGSGVDSAGTIANSTGWCHCRSLSRP